MKDEHLQLFLLPAEGGTPRQLTRGPFDHPLPPVWTPDGRVLFGSNVGGGERVWLMNADGTGQKPLTEVGESNGGAQVSPDGRYIFFMSQRSKTQQVWRKDIDGSHPKPMSGVYATDGMSGALRK